jgi:hypothetical protein
MRDLSNQIDNLPHVQSMILLSCFEVQSPKQLNPQIIILSLSFVFHYIAFPHKNH